MGETLTQTQIIRSLGEALSWFEKELAWGVAPASMNHLSGRIGELYAAMITRGQMALGVNQPGYDVVSAEGERISVKTITTSKNIRLNANTLNVVDRVLVLRINVDDDSGVTIEELFDLDMDEFRNRAMAVGDGWRLSIPAPPKPPLAHLAITDRAQFRAYTIQRYENGTLKVEQDGQELPQAKPALREIAAHIGVDIHYDEGKAKNTRQLGWHVIQTLNRAGMTA